MLLHAAVGVARGVRVAATMTCPDCDIEGEPAITRGGVAVCADCGACYTATGHATHRDIAKLSAGDIADLTRQRRRVVPHRKASRL